MNIRIFKALFSISPAAPARRLKFLLAALFMFGLALRLPSLRYPKAIVFDEVFFGRFATAYCCGHDNQFDIHPPHAKLLIAAVASAFGHTNDFKFEQLGMPFPDSVAIFGLRLVPALFGALLPALIALLIVQLGGSLAAAAIGGFALALDSAFWVQSRVIALDPQLLLATFASLSAMLASLRQVDMLKRAAYLSLTGGFAALAVGAKLTGLVCLPLLGLMLLTTVRPIKAAAKWWLLLRHCIWVASGFAIVYLAGWWWHFHLLRQGGPGDAFFVPTGRFFADMIDLHRVMLIKNAAITATHPYSSMWYTWPIMKRTIFYWSGGGGVIYLLGNPFVWYGTLLASVVALLVFLRRLGHKSAWFWRQGSLKAAIADLKIATWLPLLGYALSYVPLMTISRPLFLYHYFTPLVFMMLFVCLTLDQPLRTLAQHWTWLYRLRLVLMVSIIIGFIATLPMTSGSPLFVDYRSFIHEWLPSWR